MPVTTQELIESGEVFQNAIGDWCRRCPNCKREVAYHGDAAKGNACSHVLKGTRCRYCKTRKIVNKDTMTVEVIPIAPPVPPPLALDARGIHAILSPPPCEETLPEVIQNAIISNFMIECMRCGTKNLRKLHSDDWLYTFYCAGCGTAVKIAFQLIPNPSASVPKKETYEANYREDTHQQTHPTTQG